MKPTTTTLITLALALGGLTACTNDNPAPTPTATEATTAIPSSASPSPPEPTPSESQTPTPTTSAPSPSLDEAQTAARDVVQEFYQLQNEFLMDSTLKDLTAISSITTGDAQLLTIASVEKYRELNAEMTAPVESTILTIGHAVQDEGGETVQVEVCTDATGTDIVSKDTGESVLSEDRTPVNLLHLNVINENQSWLISTIASTPIEACP
ncbi:hypothetical protein LKO27_03465 [Tessaracoccus sp. OS52]|uniref:hypothetical protein n=1 Tax=Tessaracoccus sp. OS52 TaxID=2886691 RepID=UPI001D10990E|nr:hypothetical protein [Tessaracoccus sp. OS52]MCC2592480.1 hypothetical protein [Tessaracoccus sp. OS52]